MEGGGYLGGQPLHHVVVCIDADCFYAQVEARRLSIPEDKPLAVQQWDGLIAVNYPARAFGVRRGDRVAEALRKCPELICVHVETIGGSGSNAGGSHEPHDQHHEDKPAASSSSSSNDRSSTKVSLERYREASQEMMSVMQRYATVVEKASVDEAYMAFSVEDLRRGGGTKRKRRREGGKGDEDMVKEQQRQKQEEEGEWEDEGRRLMWSSLPPNMDACDVCTVLPTEARDDDDDEEDGDDGGDGGDDGDAFRAGELVGMDGFALDPQSAVDLPLILAARVVAKIRAAVAEEVGFTTSAGIAWNKMLAKLASARYKPNKQTVVPLAAVQSLLSTVPISEIRGLGGKLGEAVTTWSSSHASSTSSSPCKTAADLQRFTKGDLTSHFGHKSGTWLYRICRGWDEEAVCANLKPKSMLAFKSFEPVTTTEGVEAWLHVLASDLTNRLTKDREAHRRWPKTLTLQYRAGLRPEHKKNWVAGRVAELTPMVARSCPMPSSSGGGVPSQAALVSAAMKLFARCGGASALPCTRLALGASDFMDLPNDKGSIRGFFLAAATKPAATDEDDGADARTMTTTTVMGKQQEASSSTTTTAARTQVEGRTLPDGSPKDGGKSDGSGSEEATTRKATTSTAAITSRQQGRNDMGGIRGFFEQKVAPSSSSSAAAVAESRPSSSLLPSSASSPASPRASVLTHHEGDDAGGGHDDDDDYDDGHHREWSLCPRCPGQQVLLTPEHEDYHFAIQLSEQQEASYPSPSSATVGGKAGSHLDARRRPQGTVKAAGKRPPGGQKRGSLERYLMSNSEKRPKG